MGRRVADVAGHGVDPVLGQHRGEQALHLGERLGPGHLPEPVPVPDQRCPEAVGVLVQVAEGGALGTEVALAPDVLPVGPDAGDLVVLDGHLEAAHGLTQGAGTQMGDVVHHGARIVDRRQAIGFRRSFPRSERTP